MDSILLGSSFLYLLIFVIIGILSVLVNIKISSNQYRILFLFLTIALSIIAYYSTDNSDGWDINRYYADIDNMRGYDIKNALANGMYKETPITNLLFFCVSRLPNNYFLQAISTFVTLLIFSYIISDSIQQNGFHSSTVFIVVLFFFSISSFATILLGVRSFMAFSFCALAMHIESKHKGGLLLRTIPLYVIALLIHYGVALVILVRVISLGKFAFVKYLLPFWYFLGLPIFKMLAPLNSLFKLAYDKLFEYSSISSTDIRLYIVHIVVIFLLFFILYENRDKKADNIANNLKNRNCVKYNMFASHIGAVTIYHLFSRMQAFVVFTMLTDIMKSVDKKNSIKTRIVMLFISAGLMAYQLVFMYTYWRFRL